MISVARPVPGVPRRQAWTLAALIPVVGVEAVARGSAWLVALVFTVAIAMAFVVLADIPRRSTSRPLSSNLDVATAASLVLLLLPDGSSLSLAGAAAVLSVFLARNLFGGLGQNLFHPAMLALAIVGLLPLASPAGISWSPWAAPACWLAGGLLTQRGLHSWRAPTAFLAGAILLAMFMGTNTTVLERIVGVVLDPALVLCAFFVAGDPVTGCLHKHARLAYGFAAGLLAIALSTWQPTTGLPIAMLVMNFVAPWLDQVLSMPRRRSAAQ